MRRMAMSFAAIAISAIMAAAIVTLVGDATRQADQLLVALRDPASRSIVLRTSSEAPIQASTAKVIASLPGVELAVAFQQPQIATTLGLHDSAAAVGYVAIELLAGRLPIRLTAGRKPNSGEVAISTRGAQKLRMTVPLATGITSNRVTLPVVGVFDVEDVGAIGDLLNESIIGPSGSLETFNTVAFLARTPADVAVIVNTVGLLTSAGSGISIDYEPRAEQLERTVADANNQSVSQVALSVVLAGALIQIASAVLNALLQRRETARRRALGFTRPEIVFLGTFEAVLLALIGAAVGAAGATYRLLQLQTTVYPAQLAGTVGFLAALAALAAVPGGMSAAFQDPARILRVP